MKTKTIELYADLYPGWHEHQRETTFVNATNQPTPTKTPGMLRVKIIVELPEHPRNYKEDETVKAETEIEA